MVALYSKKSCKTCSCNDLNAKNKKTTRAKLDAKDTKNSSEGKEQKQEEQKPNRTKPTLQQNFRKACCARLPRAFRENRQGSFCTLLWLTLRPWAPLRAKQSSRQLRRAQKDAPKTTMPKCRLRKRGDKVAPARTPPKQQLTLRTAPDSLKKLKQSIPKSWA